MNEKNEKKPFEPAVIEIVKFDSEDIIKTSGEEDFTGNKDVF